MSKANKQSGNILFLILIAVALFAALSYAVTQSNRGGGSNAQAEKDQINTAQYLQWASNIKYAITRMKLINGCEDTDITFYNNPARPECGIFHPDGGAVGMKELPETCCGAPRESIIEGFDIPISNNSCGGSDLIHLSMSKLWIKGIGQNYEQDLAIVACGDNVQAICDELELPDEPAYGTQFSTYTGSYSTASSDPSINQLGFSGGAAKETFVGLDMGCYSSGSSKRMYIVVLER